MESKAVGFEQWGKAYGFGLRIPQLFTGRKILLPRLMRRRVRGGLCVSL